MPRLIPDEKGERNLYTLPTTGDYCVRKSVNGRERFRNLHTKNRREAIRLKEQTLRDWLGAKRADGRVPFRTMALELLEIFTVKAEKTFLDFEGSLRLHLMPYFEHSFLDEIGGLWPKYKAYQRSMDPDRKLKHDRKHLIRILRHAYEQELIHRIPKLDLDLQDRHVTPGRVYSVAEYWALWRKANWKWKLIIKMAAIMGMRRKEIMHLRWDCVDFDAGVIVLPTSAVKTRQGRVIPIEKSILRTLAARQKGSVSPYVFPNRKTPLMPMEPTDRTWQRIQHRAKVRGKFHWLRHSSVTWGLRGGHSGVLIGKSRGMSPRVLEGVYAHAELDDARELNSDIRKFLGRSSRNISERRQTRHAIRQSK